MNRISLHGISPVKAAFLNILVNLICKSLGLYSAVCHTTYFIIVETSHLLIETLLKVYLYGAKFKKMYEYNSCLR